MAAKMKTKAKIRRLIDQVPLCCDLKEVSRLRRTGGDWSMPATPGQARPLPNALYFRNQELQNDASVEVGRQKCLVRDFALPGCSLPDFRTKQARLSASSASFAAATAGRECIADGDPTAAGPE